MQSFPFLEKNTCQAAKCVMVRGRRTPTRSQLPDEVRWLHSSLLKQSEPALCFSCHGTVQAEFALPMHHRVPEGLVKCSDCHNPHGSLNNASLNKLTSETCVNCHAEKRGPYI